jgi:hypothetical protein
MAFQWGLDIDLSNIFQTKEIFTLDQLKRIFPPRINRRPRGGRRNRARRRLPPPPPPPRRTRPVMKIHTPPVFSLQMHNAFDMLIDDSV